MNGLKRGNKKVYVFHLLSLLLFIVIMPVAIFVAQKQQNTRVSAAGAMPHVQGNQIIDGFGNPLILRRAHIQSTLERIGSVATPSDVLATQHLNSGTFDVMYNSWHMNTLRLATSDWIWQSNPTAYIQVVQKAVAEANQSGLYVVISLHEDLQSGLPSDLKEPDGWSMPTSETIPYWQAIASTFKNNPMVMFDVFNEPHLGAKPARKLTDQDWQIWLHGGIIPNTNYQVYGVQDLVLNQMFLDYKHYTPIIVRAVSGGPEEFPYAPVNVIVGDVFGT